MQENSGLSDRDAHDGDEAELAVHLSMGRPDALDRLAQRYGDRLRRFLRRLLEDEHEVDDVIQDLYQRVQRSAVDLGAWGSSLAAWVFRSAHNAAVDRIRSRRIHQKAMVALRRRWGRVVVSSPLDDLERKEFQAAFEREVRELPERFRVTFLLREIEGLDYEEIAAITEVNAKTVSSRLHRARRRLREALAPWLEDSR